MADNLQIQFFNLGTQYYVSGRFASFGGFIPIAANLFHHSVEMYLKGYLSAVLSEMDRRRLSHNLSDIWTRFKREVGDQNLNKFDSVIDELHKFESIRYPEKIVADGMFSSISLSKDSPLYDANSPARTEPKYHISVEEIDELVTVIFAKASVNPSFFMDGLNANASEYLYEGNKFLPKKPPAQATAKPSKKP